MRELDFDHVTPFRPITRLNFWILKHLRGYPYKKIHNGVCHIWVGFVISGWVLSYVGGFVIYGYKFIFATYFMTVPEYIGAHIRQIPPIYDKSHPDVTNQIGRSLSLGFVQYGPLYTTVL